MQSVTSNAVARSIKEIETGQFSDVSNYFARGAELSYIKKNNSLVVFNYDGSEIDVAVPVAGWTTIAKVPYKPIINVGNLATTYNHNIFAIRITTNGELQIYNYQNTPIHINAGEVICYFTND